MVAWYLAWSRRCGSACRQERPGSPCILAPIGLLLGNVDFGNLFLGLGGGDYDSLAAAEEAGAPIIKYGLFINNVLDFLIVAFVIFLAIKGMNSLRKKEEAQPPAPPAPSAEEKLLTEIRDVLKSQSVR